MKKMTRWISLLCCLLMVLAFLGGCGDNGNDDNTDTTKTTVAAPDYGDRPLEDNVNADRIGFEKKELANANVTLFLPYEPTDDAKERIAAYETYYGGKVNLITCSWDVRISRLAQLIQSDDSPDVVSVVCSDMPTFAVKSLLDPIDGYTDLTNKVYHQESNDGIYSFNGKHYALTTFAAPYAIFFNRTMFKRAGVTAPDELYKEGNWNWDTFRQTALDMSEDTDQDGFNDVWGFGTWRDDIFLTANGTDLIKMEDGYPVLNVTDPKVAKGLQLFQDMFYTDLSIQKAHWGWYEGFRDKKVAMVFEGADWQISRLLAEGFEDEIGIVPFPMGPDATEQINYVANTGFGLGKDASNKEGGAAFIEFFLAEGYKNMMKGKGWSHLTDDQYDMLHSMLSQKAVVSLTTAYGDFSTKFFNLTDDLRAGKPVGTLLQSYAPVLQAEIDKVVSADV